MKVFLSSIVVLTGLTAAASAQIFISPVGATLTQSSEFFPVANIANGSGLSATPTFANYMTVTHSDASAATAWTTVNPNGAGDYFLAGSPGAQAIIVLNLGATYALTDFAYWGYHFTAQGGGNGNEARAFTLEFSIDGGGTYPTSVNVESPLSTLAVANSLTLNFGGTFQADTVRMTITDNHFGSTAPGGGGDRLGLGEVGFVGTLVPEPSVPLLCGLITFALLRRRR